MKKSFFKIFALAISASLCLSGCMKLFDSSQAADSLSISPAPAPTEETGGGQTSTPAPTDTTTTDGGNDAETPSSVSTSASGEYRALPAGTDGADRKGPE